MSAWDEWATGTLPVLLSSWTATVATAAVLLSAVARWARRAV